MYITILTAKPVLKITATFHTLADMYTSSLGTADTADSEVSAALSMKTRASNKQDSSWMREAIGEEPSVKALSTYWLALF